MFFEVLSAINDPNQQASVSQLGHITRAVQQIASTQGINSNQMQSMMTILGGALQPTLKQKQSQLGAKQLTSMLGRIDEPSVLTSIIPQEIQEQLIQTVTKKTGMPASVAQAMVSQVLPIVMELLNMGAPTPESVASTNSLLDTFLNSSRANNTNLGNVIKFADRFLNVPA